jgi:hypothetical protein
MSLMTIFTAPKPFTHPHIAMIQRNAIRSWLQLGPEVQVVLIGEEAGLAEAAEELGVLHLPQVKRNAQGTPLVSSIFELARRVSDSPLLTYVNADILLFSDLLQAARQVQQQAECFLIVGQRWDLAVKQPLDFSDGWQRRLLEQVKTEGRLHPRGGSDYFVFPRRCFETIPDFAIGRAGWDNWMIFEGRWRGWKVVDATGAVTIVHQDHDYSHLPQGQTHYRLPETAENVRLAGGERAIFNLLDANRRLADGKLRPFPLRWEKFWREVEIFPLVGLHSFGLAQISYAIFHPLRAYRQARAWLGRKLRR